ncbi:hypothetical protein ABW20_dc0100074 [Dactylellina cionopaga]|nr:hypothetical protein ABW20_dc0100074 [Dactylellina cionopaga]
MAWLTAHLRTLFSNKKPKNPPKNKKRPTREEKGKARAVDPDHPPNSSYSSSVSSSSALTDSDLLPILHYTELHLVPQILTQFPAFYLVGHPLPPPPLAQAKQLLTSSDEVKEKLIHPRKSTVRGYNHAKGSGREWWDYTPEDGGTKLTLDDQEFQRVTKEYFEKSIAVLQKICEEFNNFAVAIDTTGGEEVKKVVPDDVIKDFGISTMRYLRYSPVIFETENKENGVTEEAKPSAAGSSSASSKSGEGKEDGYSLPRMEAHTDHGVLTLMTATEPSGLYVWDRNGKIFSAPPIENTVLVIAGDLMTHFTAAEGMSPLEGLQTIGDHTVLPTVHAVVIPKGSAERFSLAVFLRPKKETVVSRRKVKKEDGEEVEEEMTFGKWAEEKGQIRGRRCWMIGQEKLGGEQS